MNGGLPPPDPMADSGAPPDAMPPSPSGAPMGNCFAAVPLSAIAIDGTPPAQGDKVDFSVSGTVTALTPDGYAKVNIDAINGEAVPAGDDASGAGAESLPDMAKRLRGKAAAASDDSDSY